MVRPDIRARILQAAKAVFSRDGYRAATVGGILDEARVARGTFYRYFPNKRQVYFDLLSDLLRCILEDVQALASRTERIPPDLMKDSFAQCYRIFVENRALMFGYLKDGLVEDPGLYALWDDFDHRMVMTFGQVLQNGMDNGSYRPMDKDLVSRAMFMLFLQVPYRDIMLGRRVSIDVDTIASEMVDLIVQGIGNH